MITSDEINKLIEGWTQAERQDVYGALAKLSVGTIKIDSATNTWVQPLKMDLVPAKSQQTIYSRTYHEMKSVKFVILEPRFEQVEYEDVHEITEAKIEKTWWRTRVIAPQTKTSRRIEHRSVVTVPRAIWRVRGAFVGAEMQFPTETDISGDMFGIDGPLMFRSVCWPGLDVTIQIENITSQAMPFYAVLLGQDVGRPATSSPEESRPLRERRL